MHTHIILSTLIAAVAIGNPIQQEIQRRAPAAAPPATSATLAAPATTLGAGVFPVRPQPVVDGSPNSGGVSLLTIVNKWRVKYNVPTLTWSTILAANAQKTGDDGQGSIQRHELNPGTHAQVICPGQKNPATNYMPDTPFELSYVAWLCERPQEPQLTNDNGINQCQLEMKNLFIQNTPGVYGHHDILVSTSYKIIGCAFAVNPAVSNTSTYQGLWVCDLA